MSTDGEGFWDAADRGEVVAGRYRLPDPVTGEVRSWTRASNMGAVIADRWALERYTRRQLVRGLAARLDLLEMLKACVEVDNAKADEVIATALEVAGSTAKANAGTMIHEVQRRVDLGLEVPAGMERYADGYRAALERAGLTVVAVEVLLCNRPLGAIGRGDRIYREADGTWVIGDTKSTDHLDLSQHEIAPQLTTYGCSDYVDTRGFVGEYRRFPADVMPEQPAWMRIDPAHMPLRTDYAIAIHVDRESGAVSPYRVDLHLGGYGANLATQVRAWRNVKGILLPYVRPTISAGPLPQALEAAGARHLALVPEPSRGSALAEAVRPELDQVHAHAQMLTAMAESAGFIEPQPDLGPAQLSDGSEVSLPPDVRAGQASAGKGTTLLSQAELMRLTKAQVQQYGRERGVTDLTHNKPALMVIFARAGILADGSSTQVPVRAGADPGEITGPIGGEDPTDPRSDAFRRARLAEIASASTVGELHRINRAVVARGGDQAWTDEMTEVARTRVAELDAANPVSVSSVVGLLRTAMSSQQVAELWDRITVGGSAPERWTADIDQAARERLEQIRAATPPAPANPFAGGA